MLKIEKIFTEHFLEEIKRSKLYDTIYVNSLNNLLFESQGSVLNHDIYVERISNYIYNFCENDNWKQLQYNIVIPKDIFSDIKNRFFETLICNITYVVNKDSFQKVYSNGGYMAGMSTYRKSLDRLQTLGIDITLQCTRFNLKRTIEPILAHEFIHAYQDYCMQKNNYGDLFNKMRNDGYYNVFDYHNHDEIIEKVKTIFYYIYKPEVNAYIGSIRAFIKRNCNLGDYNDIKNSINNCPIFKIYNEIDELILELSNIEDIKLQNKVLDFWNTITNIKKKNFNSLIKFLMRRCLKIKNKISITASKQVSDYLSTYRKSCNYDNPFNKKNNYE